MAIDYIRLSQHGKEQLTKLKRYTGIEHWNVLCRWAFCVSLSEPSVPPSQKIPADSNVEMTWKVFGGRYHELYLAMLKERCIQDGFDTDPETLNHHFRLHLHRGISYLAGNRNLRDIGKLVAMPLNEAA